MSNGFAAVRFAVFLVVAAVLAFLIAKVLAFALHIVFVLAGYAIAFVLAVLLMMWLWGRIAGRGNGRERDYGDRDAFGRRRY